jgi:cell division protein FtsX
MSASSLALAGLAIFYSLWSSDIQGAKNTPVDRFAKNRRSAIEYVEGVRDTRAMPLALAGFVASLLLAPPATIAIVDAFSKIDVLARLFSGLKVIKSYDAVTSLFVAVWIALIGLATSSAVALLRLRNLLKDLKGPDT